MPEPIVIRGDVIAGMPAALRAELGVDSGRPAEVVAVTVPAGDVPDVVRLHAGSATAGSSACQSAIRIATRHSSLPRAGRRPEIARILTMLPADMSPWQIAFWFASGNGWIEDDKAPQDALHDLAHVLAAAADLASDEVG